MNDSTPEPESSNVDMSVVWAAFEAAWYEEPPRRLTPDELCRMFPRHSCERIHEEYRERWLDLRRSDLRVELENLVREWRSPNWEKLVGDAPELLEWAKAHFANCGRRDASDFLADAAACLNLRDYPGSRATYEKERLRREREQAKTSDQLKQIERDFELTGVAGSGGFGIVFEAYDAVLDRRVAVKKVLPGLKNRSGAQERLEREAMILAKLEHPNILPMYNILKPHPQAGDEAEPAFVMRLLPETLVRDNSYPAANGDRPKILVRRLKDAIQEFYSENLPWDATTTRRNKFRQLLQQFVDVCHGIAYAHQRKVIHRDIKPGNVVIGPHGETVIIDWGIARVLLEDERRSGDLSRPGTLVEDMGLEFPLDGSGTGPYASPEQWPRKTDKARPVHPKLTFEAARQPADVYALGATLWEILNGRTPSDGISYEHRFDDFPAGTPYTLQQIVRKATAFDPWDRYVGQRELEWFQQQLPSLKERSTTGTGSTACEEDACLNGVEQLRNAVQNWLDQEAIKRVTDVYDKEIEETRKVLETTRNAVEIQRKDSHRLKLVTNALAVLALFIGLAATFAFWKSRELSTTNDSLATNIESLSTQKRNVESEIGQLRATNRSLTKNVHKSKQRAKSSELNTVINLLSDGSIGDATSRLGAIDNPPDTFPWNFAKQAISGEGIRTLTGSPEGIDAHRGQVLAVGLNQKGEYLSFGIDGRLIVWDAATEKPLREFLVGPTVGRLGLAVEAKQEHMIVSGLTPDFPAARSGQIQVNDEILAVGKSADTMVSVSGMSVSDVGKMLSDDASDLVSVKFLREGNAQPFVVELTRKPVSTLTTWSNINKTMIPRFSPDGRWLAAGAQVDKENAKVWLIDTATGTVKQTWPAKETEFGFVHSLNFSGNSERLVLSGTFPTSADKPDEYELKGIVIDLTQANVPVIDKELINSGFPPIGWVMSRDGNSVMGTGLGLELAVAGRWAVGESDAKKKIHALNQLGLVASPSGFFNTVSPDGRFLATGNFTSPVDIFLGDGSEHIVTLGRSAGRRGMAFNLDSTLFAVADGNRIDLYANGWQRLANIPFDMTLQSPGVHPVLAFTSDGQSLLVGSEAGLQIVPARNVIDSPAHTDFGPLASFTACRWSVTDNKPMLWVAESDGSRPGVRLQMLAFDGSVQDTLVSSLSGHIQSIPVMSQDGKRVFVSRTPAHWAKTSRLEAWGLEGQQHLEWSRSFDSGVARVLRDFPDGGIFVECYTDRPQFKGDGMLGHSWQYWDQAGQPLKTVPRELDGPWRITPHGELLSIYPSPLSTVVYGHAGDAAIYLTSQDRTHRRALKVQALNAVVSDDNQYLAAVVVTKGQKDWTNGTLKIYRMSDFEEIASFDDHLIGLPFDFGLNFSPDGNQVAVTTIGGQVFVWDHVKRKVLFDNVWEPEGWQQGWVSGAIFTPDGNSLLIAGYDRQALTDLSRWGADPKQIGGLMGIIELQAEQPAIRVVRDDVGMVVVGEASKDRSRICTFDMVSGETRVWDVSKGDPQQVAALKSSSGVYDPRWAQLVLIDALAIAPDQKHLAAAGSALVRGMPVTRIVVFNVEKKTVDSSVDIALENVHDLAWLSSELRLLTHLEEKKDEGTKRHVVRLRTWSPGTPEMTEIATHEDASAVGLRQVGASTHAQFSLNGEQYAVPMLLVDANDDSRGSQVPFVFRSEDGTEMARPTKCDSGHNLQGFQWGYDGRLAIATIVDNKKDLSRHVSLWNPHSGDLKQFITDRRPRTDAAFAGERQGHLMISPDGDSVIIGKVNQPYVEVWSESEEQLICRIALKRPQVLRTLQISPKGDALFLAQKVAGATLLRAPRKAEKDATAESLK